MTSTQKQFDQKSYQAEWRKANPEKYKEQRKREGLKRYYGMTVEAWDAFSPQGYTHFAR